MNERVFKSIEEFERHYFPKDCERHPVVMRVSKEEADYIRHRRGGWGAKKR